MGAPQDAFSCWASAPSPCSRRSSVVAAVATMLLLLSIVAVPNPLLPEHASESDSSSTAAAAAAAALHHASATRSSPATATSSPPRPASEVDGSSLPHWYFQPPISHVAEKTALELHLTLSHHVRHPTDDVLRRRDFERCTLLDSHRDCPLLVSRRWTAGSLSAEHCALRPSTLTPHAPTSRRAVAGGVFFIRPAAADVGAITTTAGSGSGAAGGFQQLASSHLSSRRIARSGTFEEWIRSFVGPSHLRLLLEGTNGSGPVITGHLMFEAKTPGLAMIYFTSVQPSDSPTTVLANMKVAHTDWWGVREDFRRTLHAFNKYALSRSFAPIVLQQPLANTTDPQRQCSHGTRDVRSGADVVIHTAASITDRIGCDSRFWRSFRWVFADARGRADGLRPTDRKGRTLRGAQWEFRDQLNDRPVLPPTWSAADLRACVQKLASGPHARAPLRLMITGDSQSRSIFWGVSDYVRYLESGDNNATLSFELRDEEGKKTTRHGTHVLNGTLEMFYRWDSYLENLRNNADEADIVVAGFGAHPASWGQWTYDEFERQMRQRVASALCPARGGFAKSVIWYGAPAWPKPKTVENFRATNVRLALFNTIARRVLSQRCPRGAVRFLDFFAMTDPHLKLSKDSAHYDGTIVIPTLAQHLFAAVCQD